MRRKYDLTVVDHLQRLEGADRMSCNCERCTGDGENTQRPRFNSDYKEFENHDSYLDAMELAVDLAIEQRVLGDD